MKRRYLVKTTDGNKYIMIMNIKLGNLKKYFLLTPMLARSQGLMVRLIYLSFARNHSCDGTGSLLWFIPCPEVLIEALIGLERLDQFEEETSPPPWVPSYGSPPRFPPSVPFNDPLIG